MCLFVIVAAILPICCSAENRFHTDDDVPLEKPFIVDLGELMRRQNRLPKSLPFGILGYFGKLWFTFIQMPLTWADLNDNKLLYL